MRSYRALTVNTEAQSYTEFCDLHALISGGANLEPPLVVTILDGELEAIKQQPLATDIPSHMQSTERTFKLTIEAVGAVSGADRQTGLLLNKRASRERQSGQICKKHFKV